MLPPESGVPSEASAVPDTVAARIGCRLMSIAGTSCPIATFTRVASATFAVPGKYDGAYTNTCFSLPSVVHVSRIEAITT